MKKYLSELAGTYGLVFIGTGAMIINDLYGGLLTHFGVALAWGLAVLSMVLVFAKNSGAHINPAMTLGFWFAGRFPGNQVLPYLLAQLTGAILASLTLSLLFAGHRSLGETLPAGDPTAAFFLELIMTCILMTVAIFVSTGARELGAWAAIAVGTTVFLEAFFGGPVSGASMNPARSIGPAFVSGNLHYLWIYLSAPLAGALLAIPGCRMVRGKKCCPLPDVFYWR